MNKMYKANITLDGTICWNDGSMEQYAVQQDAAIIMHQHDIIDIVLEKPDPVLEKQMFSLLEDHRDANENIIGIGMQRVSSDTSDGFFVFDALFFETEPELMGEVPNKI